MSETLVHRHGPDRNRTIASLAAALAIHVAVLLLIGLFVRLGMSAAAEQPTIIDVQLQSGTVSEEPSGGGGPAAGAPAGPAPSVPAATARPTPSSGGGDAFTIPTPRGRPAESSASAPTGPSFQTSGSRTGVAESLPPVQREPQPAVTVGQQGKTTGSSSGSGSTQRSGQGVLVTGSKGKTGDSLDLSQVDKAMANRGSGSGGTAAAGSGGAATSGSGGAAAGSGGSGSGSGSGGSSSGSGRGKGAGGTGPGNYRLELPGSGKGRTVVSSVKPVVPAWVNQQGLTMTIVVTFTLQPDGLISAASPTRSTGYADVDAKVVEAIRRWRFTQASGGGSVQGVITYIINPR
jgi:TonB family protein